MNNNIPPKDPTAATRQARRTYPLNMIAIANGWTGWSEYCTAVINGYADIPQKNAWREKKKLR